MLIIIHFQIRELAAGRLVHVVPAVLLIYRWKALVLKVATLATHAGERLVHEGSVVEARATLEAGGIEAPSLTMLCGTQRTGLQSIQLIGHNALSIFGQDSTLKVGGYQKFLWIILHIF